MCKTGVVAGSSAGADKEPDRRQSNHERTDDQAGRRRLANTDSDGGSLVHATDDTPSKNAATRDKHCNFTRQGVGRPSAAAGSRRNRTRQAVADVNQSLLLQLPRTVKPRYDGGGLIRLSREGTQYDLDSSE